MARTISKPKSKSTRSERRAKEKLHGKASNDAFVPTREDILKYIDENPDRSGKRDIAKAFNLKGDARIHLKDILRDLADDGSVEKRAKRLSRPGSLPPISVLDIKALDRDGGLLAKPVEWDEGKSGKAPIVSIRRARSGDKVPVVGVGDRVMAKIFRNNDGNHGTIYSARVIKKLEKRTRLVLGILRQISDGEWRLEPVDRKQSEVIIDPQSLGDAKAGDLVEVNTAAP